MRHKAFTLVELLIVVAIIAILSTIGVVAYSNAREKSKISKAKAEVGSIANAIKIYYSAEKSLPGVITSGCYAAEATCLAVLQTKGYIQSLSSGPDSSSTCDDTTCYKYYYSSSSPRYYSVGIQLSSKETGPFKYPAENCGDAAASKSYCEGYNY